MFDNSVDDTFEYDAVGNLEESYNLDSGNTAPRGLAADATGSTVWVIDNDDYVYVYDTDGNQLRSWKASGLSRPKGIATDGTSVWIVDRGNDRVHFFGGGATRTSNTGATSSCTANVGERIGSAIAPTDRYFAAAAWKTLWPTAIGTARIQTTTLERPSSDVVTIDRLWPVPSADPRIDAATLECLERPRLRSSATDRVWVDLAEHDFLEDDVVADVALVLIWIRMALN
jgi:hypothetical protein